MRKQESNYTSGALSLVPPKKRRIKHRHVEVGKLYECDMCKRGPFKYPFRAEAIYIYEKSAMVKIIATHEVDDHLINRLQNRVIIELKNMTEVSE